MPPTIVHLVAAGAPRAAAGHPWIWRSEIARVEGEATPGEPVTVRNAAGGFVGVGYLNARSVIAVRLLSRHERPLDAGFWRERLAAAIAYRAAVMPGAEALRLVNSESDQLPGLIVDRYGDQLVVQITTAGIERQRDAILAALAEVHPARAVIERSDMPIREREGLAARAGVVAGASDGTAVVRVADATFACDLLDPHKTGFYLDQSANYRRVAARVRSGARVLDVCCHLGGFAVHAALAGAGEVVAIDQAPASITGTTAAAERNGVAGKIRGVVADAFEHLKAASKAGEKYDLIVLDPPAFARDRDAVKGALRGYKDLHLRALKMLAPGGVLATFSCSHHVSPDAFLATLVDAAADAGLGLRLEERLAAAPDHPVLPAVPETEYLKGFVVCVLGD